MSEKQKRTGMEGPCFFLVSIMNKSVAGFFELSNEAWAADHTITVV